MKEAFSLMHPVPLPRDKLWQFVWAHGTWPKVSTFLWLLSHKRILTWDNLLKQGFIGPSQCPNCKQNIETIQHLMLTCTLASKLCEKICFRSQRSKPQGDLTSIMRLWPKHPYNSPILNTLWQIIPGLLFWSLWKERNRRIFKHQSTPLDIIWRNFSNNLQESLALHSWQEEDLPKQPKEAIIWKNW